MKRVILLVLVLAVLAAGIYFVLQADRADQLSMSDLYTEVEPLQREKETLVEERASLEEEYDLLLRDPSTIQLVFRELDESIFTDIYPLMRDRGITGVLGLSMREYPNQYKKLTKEQFSRLVMDGWGTCLIFDKEYANHIDSWIKYMTSWIERDEYAMPTAIYFPDNTYDPETMDEVLQEAGFNTVILDAEDGHSTTVSNVGTIWYTGAMPWNYTGISNDVELLSFTDSANLSFTVSIENIWDAYDRNTFVALLDSWEEILVRDSILDPEITPTPVPSDPLEVIEWTIEPQLKVTTYESARTAHLEAADSRDALIREHDETMAALDEQIAALDERIDAIYEAWGNK